MTYRMNAEEVARRHRVYDEAVAERVNSFRPVCYEEYPAGTPVKVTLCSVVFDGVSVRDVLCDSKVGPDLRVVSVRGQKMVVGCYQVERT